MPSIEEKVARTIRGRGHGWCFSQHDLVKLGSRSALDLTLHRLTHKGVIRRVIRGVYHYPRYSKLLEQNIGPDIDQVAQALARKFGWRIRPSGQAALNLIGLSTQIPAQYLYLSDGPSRSYHIGDTALVFKQTALKEAGFKYPESSLIVQALKSLGHDHLNPNAIATIRDWLDPNLRQKILNDTRSATGWVYVAIKQICREDSDE